MGIVVASTKKVYASDEKPMLRLLSSGIKLSAKTMKDMGLEAGDKVNFAEDDESGEIYLLKSAAKGDEDGQGNVLGSNKCFTNTALWVKLATQAGDAAFEAGSGRSISFSMATEGIEGTYFEIIGGDIITNDKKENNSAEVVEEAAEEEL
jgi:hypothetical protein